MSLFTLWGIDIDNNTDSNLTMLLGPGDIDDGIYIDKLFFESVLSETDVTGELDNWKIEAFRTNYFSQFLDEDDWRDIWQIIWRISLNLKGIVSFSNDPGDYWGIALSSMGESFRNEPDYEDEVNCLLIANLDSVEAASTLKTVLEKSEDIRSFHKKGRIDRPKMQVFNPLANVFQLQIDLGSCKSDFYKSGAEYAQDIIELVERYNGTTNFQDIEW